jgi:hypothetical protein
MATRISSLSTLTAALVAGLALSFAPITPVHADEDPGARPKRVAAPRYHAPRYHAPRIRTVVRVRTVERVRTRIVYVRQPAPQPVYYTCGGCAPAPQPVVYVAPAVGCGSCAPVIPRYESCCQPGYGGGAYYGGHGYHGGGYYGVGYRHGAGHWRGAPYRWAVRTARYHRHGWH